MSWTNCYPVFEDSQITDFENIATLSERSELDDWFAVERHINSQTSTHLVAVSLFWKNLRAEDGELEVMDREQMKNAAKLGLVSFFPPWEHYVMPLLKGAAILRKERPDVVLRVYLAADLEFLIEDLVSQGCEVYLMKSSSIRHNPGAMWRFLALEERDKWITVIDADRGEDILADVERTEQVMTAGLGLWRVPYFFDQDLNDHDPAYYRPINACQFGAKGGERMTTLLKAFIWHNRRGTMTNTWLGPANLKHQEHQPIAVSIWPDYGFDEWFLLAAVYPRLAFEGVITFFHWRRPELSICHTLDIEYVTWANPRSEVFCCRNTAEESDLESQRAEPDLTIRDGAAVIVRERDKIGSAQRIFSQPAPQQIQKFPSFHGSLPELLAWVDLNVTMPWWVDLSPHLKLGRRGGELFCDRRYSNVDIVVCGHSFTRITNSLSGWGEINGLDWHEDGILKFPKVEGPMTLWNTEFSHKFHREGIKLFPEIEAGIILQAWLEQGKANVLNTTARQMGWSVR